MAAETLKALLTTWRASEDHIRRNHPGDPLRLDPDTLSDCADELEAVLALCESPAAERMQEPLFVHIGWLLAKVMKDTAYPEARVIWEQYCDWQDRVKAPPTSGAAQETKN